MMSFQNQEVSSTTDADQYVTANMIETRMLYLSTQASQCRLLNGDMKSRVEYDLKNYLDFQGDDTIQSVTLAMPYAILVNSNYLINSNNCLFDFIFNSVEYSFNFPYGNYDADSFIKNFNAFINIATIGVALNSFNLALDTVSSRFNLTNTVAPFTILGTTTCDYIMGFSGNISSSTVNFGSGYYLGMPRVCNFLPNPLFRICIENNTFYNGQVLGGNGRLAYSNVLASIPNTTKANTQIVYQNFADEFATQLSGQTTLTLSILDVAGNYVDFQGISSYFQLRIRIYRRVKRSLKSFNNVLASATNLRTEIEENSEGVEKPIEEII